MDDRRRMMAAASGGGPLVVYEQGDNKFQNCTVYERSGYENKTFVFYSSYVLIGKSGSVYYLDLGVDFTKYNTLHIVCSTPQYYDGNIGYSQRAHPLPSSYTASAEVDTSGRKTEFTFDISARTGTWRIHFRGDQIYVYDIWLD